MTLTVASTLGTEPKVLDALRTASASSGVDFDYLLNTAQRESGLDPTAKSKTSSAAGLFQFVKQTWLATLKEHGAEHGYGVLADAIGQDAKGRYFVTDKTRAGEIFALRSDPAASCAMAAELTKETTDLLQARLGRVPTEGELYAAHVLGVGGASRLIKLADANPETVAETCFPEAAAANRGLFNDSAGAPVTVSALYDRLTGGNDQPACLAPTVAEAPTAADDTFNASVGVWQSVLSARPPAPQPVRAATAQLPTSFGGRFGYGGVPLTLTPQLLSLLSTLDPTKATASDSDRRS